MESIKKNGNWGFIAGDSMGAAAEFGERWIKDLDPVKEIRSVGVFI